MGQEDFVTTCQPELSNSFVKKDENLEDTALAVH